MAMKLTRNNTVRLMALSLKRYSEFCSVILKKAIATRIVDIPKAIEIARNGKELIHKHTSLAGGSMSNAIT